MSRHSILTIIVIVPWLGACTGELGSGHHPLPDGGPPIRVKRPQSPEAGVPTRDSKPDPYCPGTDIDQRGTCESNVAIWCDAQQQQLKFRNCAEENKVCKEEGCGTGGQGVDCCDKDEPVSICGSMPADGECVDNKARWCDPNLGIQEMDCTAQGEKCEIGTCAAHVSCCPTEPEPNECQQLGWVGKCQGDTLRFCTGSNETDIQSIDCAAKNQVCQENSCFPNGADCCDK